MTAYVILMWIGVVLVVLGAILLMVALPELGRRVQFPRQFLAVIAVIVLGIATFEFVLGLGLWNMKNWARVVLLILTGLGLLGNVISLTGAYGVRNQPSSLGGAVVGFVVGAFIFYWFATHGDYFE